MTNKRGSRSWILAGMSALIGPLGVSAASAAAPPALVGYQGVLRDQDDRPLSGSFDMVLRLMDAATGGNEILRDQHSSAGSNAVTVSGGLFDVALGSGTVSDGAGPGNYTSPDAVFRDFTNVWLEVQIGGETLAPRTRIQSAAYALNATTAAQLGGQPPSAFLDTSAATQTKAGALNAQLVTASTSAENGRAISGTGTGSFGTGVYGYGTAFGVLGFGGDTGGYFNGSNYGIQAEGSGVYGAGGYFLTGEPTTFGVLAYSPFIAGRFQSSGGSGATADLGADNVAVRGLSMAPGGNGVIGSGEHIGVSGYASGQATAGANGGSFTASGPQSTGVRAQGATGVSATGESVGISAYGTSQGGRFSNVSGDSVTLADSANDIAVDASAGTYGVRGHGGTAGGVFSSPGTGIATLASGEIGLSASGAASGSYHSNGSPWFSYAYLPFQNIGVLAYGSTAGAQLLNFATSAFANVGYSSYKIQGNGSVSFVQNHPTDRSKVIVYAAPEGDEVAVYTRGSGRLVGGEARVALGETFALVANPDIGLTATVTSRGEPIPLAVVAVTANELVVHGPAGSAATFDYMVWGLRIGFEEQSIIQPKQRDARIPSMYEHELFFQSDPSLRSATALARYSEAHTRIEGRDTLDLSRASRLRDAIGVFAHQEPSPEFQRAQRAEAGIPAPVPSEPAELPREQGARVEGPSGWPAGATPGLIRPGDSTDDASTAAPASLLFEVTEPVDAGDLLALDPLQAGRLRRTDEPHDTRVIGVAERPSTPVEGVERVALAGGNFVFLNADAQFGAILPGDLLVSSPTPGSAMVSRAPLPGTVVGKALDPLAAGRGRIRVQLMSR